MVLKWLLKKLASSEHSTHGFCSRRKIVSGFGLGVGATLFVLALILLSQSFKASFLSPIFQGFNNLSGNSSLVSWPFLFSNASLSPPPDLLNSMDLMPLNDNGRGQEKTHEANASKTSQNAFLLDPNGVENLREKIHRGNSSEKGKNESFSNQRLGEETPRGNFSEDVKNASFSNQGDGIGKTQERKSVGHVATGNFTGKSEGFTMNAHVGQSGVNETNNVRNVSDDGPDVHSLGKDERFSTTTLKGNLSDKDHMASFSGLVKKADGSLQCDIFDGKWVRDDTMPYYPPGSCPFIDRDFDCHLNGRPDDELLRWRWQPNRCDIPRLNSTDFLERLRGKRLVFVGDSLNRNMWESLVCILRHGVADKSKVYEISGRREFKKKGFYAFRYEDYNCSIDFVDAPFLVRESSFKGKSKSFETLRLDLMDRTTMMYHEADVLVFNTGHWWTHEKTSRGEGYYQEGNYVHPKLKVMVAYRKALTTWARWIDKNIDPNKTQVFFRGYSVTHFRGGQWNSGGQCHRETEPIFNGTYLAKYPSKMRALEHVLQEMRTPIIYLNISRLTDYRKDGHPSIYRKEYKTVNEKIAAERSQDCSHWCLPGVPDTWNNLLYISLLITGKGSWRN